ncbi:hypothetical protein [Dactylosporangium sp. NPDC049140]|uniref:hypothetical protein n=1 Tax=Dactylosporangium sp. NPDC049140 TaxID=3155647 RepID=UPI0033E2753E
MRQPGPQVVRHPVGPGELAAHVRRGVADQALEQFARRRRGAARHCAADDGVVVGGEPESYRRVEVFVEREGVPQPGVRGLQDRLDLPGAEIGPAGDTAEALAVPQQPFDHRRRQCRVGGKTVHERLELHADLPVTRAAPIIC